MKCKKVKLGDVIEFNPKETLKKNDIAKKIPMDALTPFTRKIDYFELAEFKGGTKFKNDDTLMARITPCLENGKTSFVDILEENEVGFGSTEYFVLRAKEEILPKYLYYLSISNNLRSAVIKSMTGTSGRQRAQKESLLNFEIFLPNITDQKKILGLLDSIDTKIELNNQMIDTLEEVTSTLFKRWFVDFEFPDENGNPYKSSGGKMIDSELGEIPEGWRIVALKDVFHQKKENFNPGKYPNTEVMHFSMPSFDKSKLPIIDNTNDIKSNKNIVGENSVLFSKMNPETKRVWLPNFTENSFNVTSTEFIVVDSNEEDKMFLYTLLLSLDFQNYLVTNATGSTGSRQRIRPSTAMDYTFAYSEEMKRKANLIIGRFSEKIINLRTEIQTLEDVRDSLLPKLLSGEIEL